MGTPLAAFTNGDVMSATVVAAALTAARAYLDNGVVTADVADASLGFENIFRPDVYLVPQPWQEAESQTLTGRVLGIDQDCRPSQDPAEGRGVGKVGGTGRVDIFPFRLIKGNQLPVRGLGVRRPIQADALADITACFFAHAVAGPALFDHAGRFVLCYKRVQDDIDGSGIVLAASQRQVWSLEERGQIVMSGQILLEVDGDYDFFVVYQRGSCSASVQQIVVVTRSFVVEVHQQTA